MLAASAATAQNPSGISFTLAAKSGQTRFIAGETIEVELRLSTTSPAQYQIWTSGTARTVRQPKFDHFTVEPASGVSDPLRDIFAQMEGGIAGVPPRPVPLGAQPVVIEMAFNEWLSFRQPGHYRITAETTRVTKISAPDAAISLRSNAMEIDVAAPPPGWASVQVRQATATLERGDLPQPGLGRSYDSRLFQAHDEEAARAARILRFIDSPDAVPALARFFENGPRGAQTQLHAGLFASPYRQEVIAAMEAWIAAPDSPVTYYYLATLMELEEVRRLGPTPLYTARTPAEAKQWSDEVEAPRRGVSRAIENDYFAKLAEAIKGKRGRARAVSLDTLIANGPQPPAPAAIQALVNGFSDLSEGAQHNLLTLGWARIASPSIRPLVQALASGPNPDRDAALERLRELDPVAARRIALERIRRGDIIRNTAGSDPRALLTLPDKTLPALDDALLTALEQGKPVDLLLARYASEAAFPRVRAFIERSPSVICAGGWVAYLFRVQPAYAAELLARVRASGHGGCAMNLSPNEDLLVSPGLERQAIADLSSPDPMTRRGAQNLLQYAGSAQAEQPLWDAMSHIRDRAPGPLDADEFGISDALSKALAWTLTPEKTDRLIGFCRSDSCRHDATAMRRWLAGPISITEPGLPGVYANLGLFHLRSAAQMRQKLSQFPKGTAFSLEIRESTWYGKRRGDEIRKLLEANGMKLVEPGPHSTGR